MAQDRRILGHVRGLDQELAECRVREIVQGTAEHHLGVAGDLELTCAAAVVGDREAAHLHVVLAGHGDLELGLEIFVTPAEDRALGAKVHLVVVGDLADRMVGRGPDLPAPGRRAGR